MNQALCSLQSSGAALSPRRATHLFLLRQNKVSQKKATLLSASLRFAAGNLRCSLQAGSAQTRCAQTVCRPDPPEAPLLGADRRGGVRIRIRGVLSPQSGLNTATFLIAGYARILGAIGLNARETASSNSSFINAVTEPDQGTNCTGFRGSFITGQMCSTFSRSPIHMRLSEEFDAQIKLQLPD